MQCTIIANLILIHFFPINSQFITFFFQPEQQIWKVICGLISSSWSKIITVFSSLCTVLVFEPVQTNWISAQAKVWKCYARNVWMLSCLVARSVAVTEVTGLEIRGLVVFLLGSFFKIGTLQHKGNLKWLMWTMFGLNISIHKFMQHQQHHYLKE